MYFCRYRTGCRRSSAIVGIRKLAAVSSPTAANAGKKRGTTSELSSEEGCKTEFVASSRVWATPACLFKDGYNLQYVRTCEEPELYKTSCTHGHKSTH